jgi:glycosyltransferase involved in cell wall biosynthesis
MKPPRRRSVVLDLRPLQGGDAGRGIGATVRGLAGSFPEFDVLLWRGLRAPEEARHRGVVTVRGPARESRMSWAVDAAYGRATRLRGTSTLWHLTNADVSYDGGGAHVLSVNDTIPWRFPDLYAAGPTGRVRMAVTGYMARKARRVVVPSRVSGEDVTRYLGVPAERVDVVPWASDPEISGSSASGPDADELKQLREGLGIRSRYIVMAGGFAHHDPRKRYLDAAGAMRKLPEEVSLVVTGSDGPAAPRFRASVEEMGLASRVVLTGHLQIAQMASLFSGASAFVFPSLWEGFGLPLLDAFSLSVPAVVSDGGSLPEVAGEAALVYPAGDISELATALVRILEDPGLAADLVRRGKKRSLDFSWAETARMFRSVYVEAGADPGDPS